MLNFYVYILKCNDGSYYVGHTENLEQRLSAYNQNLSPGYVSSRLPVTLVFHESVGSRGEAIEVERQLKGWSRKKKEILINEGWEKLRGFCRKNKKRLME